MDDKPIDTPLHLSDEENIVIRYVWLEDENSASLLESRFLRKQSFETRSGRLNRFVILLTQSLDNRIASGNQKTDRARLPASPCIVFGVCACVSRFRCSRMWDLSHSQ